MTTLTDDSTRRQDMGVGAGHQVMDTGRTVQGSQVAGEHHSKDLRKHQNHIMYHNRMLINTY